MARSLKREFWNAPNMITLTRIAMIPVFLWFTFYESRLHSFIAATVFGLTSATDFLDGYIARKHNLITVIGKFLDPLADKLIVSATLVFLTVHERCPAWLVVALLARDLAVTGLRSLAAAEGLVLSASDEGKQKTAFQMTGTIFLLIHFRYQILFLQQTLDYHQIGIYTLYVSLVMSIISATNYVRRFVGALYASRATPDPPDPPATPATLATPATPATPD